MLGKCSKVPLGVPVCQLFLISLERLSYVPSTSSAVKTPENTKQNPEDPELADKGGIFLYDGCAGQIWEQEQKITFKNLRLNR